jgi:hypothetical protein
MLAKARWSRLVSLGWDELRTRGRQEISKRWHAARYRLGIPIGVNGVSPLPSDAAHFFFAPDEVTQICALIRERFPRETEQIVDRAERICQHRFDLLGYQNLDYGPEIDWHLDAVHGKRAPRKPWHRIRFLDFDQAGDARITWELNRHQHLVTLAKAYCLTEQERYAAELFRQWCDWQKQNPYPIGINWASSLEVAFRSLSWFWVQHLLVHCPAVPARFQSDLTKAQALNGSHIERYLSTYFSPNTHLLGEGVALFFIGTLCPQIPNSWRWKQCGWEIVLQQADRQVRPDGMHFEQSTYYHVYALDFFLHARILAAANQIPIPAAFDQKLEKMLQLLCALGSAGAPPRWGDDDGGRVFDPQRNRAEHLLDPLSTGAALFGRPQFKAVAGGVREETLWLLGPKGLAQLEQIPAASTHLVSTGFESSGIYVMASSGPRTQQLVIDAGPQGVGRAGHGHADGLSLRLAIDGREYLVDPGTCAYISRGPERDLFRSTAAHNTLQVDGHSQADPSGPFSWRNLPHVSVERWVAGETFDLFAASHTGYARLPKPIIHRRFVFHLKSRFWLVRDFALGDGIHKLDLFWHLAPGSAQHQEANAVVVSSEDQQSLALVPVANPGWMQKTSAGWFSRAYGTKEPSPVVCFGAMASLPAEFATLLVPMRKARAELGTLTQMRDKAVDSSVRGYEYRSAREWHSFFFAERNGRWQLGKWASDAQFLYLGAFPEGELQHVVFCGGSYVEMDGQRLFASQASVARFEWLSSGTSDQVFCSGGTAFSQLPRAVAEQSQAVLSDGQVPTGSKGAD